MGADVVLHRIHVQAGAVLVFQDEDIVLNLRELRVEAGGELFIGLETCPLFSNIAITLHGTRADSRTTFWDQNLTRTSKGIQVAGRAEMHGKKYAPTWSRLARTAAAGDAVLFISDANNWEVGGEVMLTTTTFFDCPDNYKDAWCKPCASWQTCSG